MRNISPHQFDKYDSVYKEPERSLPALSQYSSDGMHEHVNKYLRHGQMPEAGTTDHSVHSMMRVLKQNTEPAAENMTVYRAGGHHEDKGYMSTSSHSAIADRFKDDGNVNMYEINVPKGAPHIPFSNKVKYAGQPGEVVLPPGKLNETSREGGRIKATYEPF